MITKHKNIESTHSPPLNETVLAALCNRHFTMYYCNISYYFIIRK